MELKVGTCGWQRFYLVIPPSKRKSTTILQLYATHFPVVEINSSHYKFHKLKTYEGWRDQVPKEFEFTLKCHKNITHEEQLKPTQDALNDFSKMVEAAKACDAKILLIQTPASLKPTDDVSKNVNEFFENVELEKIQLVWETRGKSWDAETARKKLKTVLEPYEITHVVDPLKNTPAHLSNIAYFRLHGMPGYNLKHKYTNDELRQLYERIVEFKDAVDRIYLFFNNYTMYRDAQRFLYLYQKGELPPSPFGFRSVLETLSVYEAWPATKEQLIKDCGSWYLWIEPNKSIRLREILRYFEEKTYANLDEIEEESKRIWDKISQNSDKKKAFENS